MKLPGFVRKRQRHTVSPVSSTESALPPPASVAAKADFDVGFALAGDEKYEQAETPLRRACAYDPANGDYQYWLGVCLWRLGRHQEAEAHLRRACELKPNDSDCYAFLGAILTSHLGRHEEAEIFLRRASILENKDSNVNFWLGHCLFHLGNFEEAANVLNGAYDTETEDHFYVYWLGRSLVASGQFVNGLNYLRRAYELLEDAWEYNYWLGYCLLKMGKYVEAEPLLSKSLELGPGESDQLLSMGLCLVAMHRYLEAYRPLLDACEQDPENNEKRFWFAYCLSSIGHGSEAREQYNLILSDGTDSTFAANALNNLGVIEDQDGKLALAMGLTVRAIEMSRRMGEWKSAAQNQYISNLQMYLERQTLDSETRHFLREFVNSFGIVQSNGDEPTTPVVNIGFEEWLERGAVWLDAADWTHRRQSGFLRELHASGAEWSNPANWLFPHFNVGEDEVDEALATAESLSDSLRRQPEWPVFLDASDLRVAMTLERGFVRAWVGRGLSGLAVSFRPTDYELRFLSGDRDARFAIGAVIHWFLDCCLGIESHPKFTVNRSASQSTHLPWKSEGVTWLTRLEFDADIQRIMSNPNNRPPRAHRVRGHVRTLVERIPNEESRLRAPAYIRRSMGPNDTWVAAYTKGDGLESQKLVARLATHSSLADYLATSPRSG